MPSGWRDNLFSRQALLVSLHSGYLTRQFSIGGSYHWLCSLDCHKTASVPKMTTCHWCFTCSINSANTNAACANRPTVVFFGGIMVTFVCVGSKVVGCLHFMKLISSGPLIYTEQHYKHNM